MGVALREKLNESPASAVAAVAVAAGVCVWGYHRFGISQPRAAAKTLQKKGCTRFVKIPSPGGYEKLEVVNAVDNTPTCGANIHMMGISDDDCVVVNIVAAGVNYADVCIRWGLYESAKQFVGWSVAWQIHTHVRTRARLPSIEVYITLNS